MMMINMMMVTMIMSVATAHSIVYVIYCTPHCEGVLAIPYHTNMLWVISMNHTPATMGR